MGYRQVAHQMELLTIGIHALGNVYQCTILSILCHLTSGVDLTHAQTCQHCLIHLVSDGTDGGHWCHLYVLYHTDVEVSIGTHHRWVAAGTDVLTYRHSIRPCLTAIIVEHKVCI